MPDKLLCHHCNQSVLVEGYDPSIFIGIRIQCHKCHGFTETPGLPAGEILPRPVVSFGKEGGYPITTVEVPSGIILTSDQEVEKQSELTKPRTIDGSFQLSEAGISEIEKEYDRWSNGALVKQTLSVRRAMSAGHSGASEFPFAWACQYLRRRLDEGGAMPTLKADRVSLRALLGFNHFIRSWGHHPRLPEIGRSFAGASSFWHNINQLAVASYLSARGNNVGIGLTTTNGQPSADLYLRIDSLNKLHIEVKAPAALHWPTADAPNSRLIEKVTAKSLRSAAGQLNRGRRGVLVLGTCLDQPNFESDLAEGIQKALRSKGRDHRGVAAVSGVTSNLHALHNRYSIVFQFSSHANPHYDGDNPVKI